MIPILFNQNETLFQTQGLGALKDCISCYVTEERNGIYELEMVYPQTGIHFSEIQKGCYVYAIPSPYRSPQAFEIYKITKPLNGNVTVYAQHISYKLNKIPVSPFTAANLGAAFSVLPDKMAISNNFNFWTDKSSGAEFSVEIPTSCRSCLGGQTGSILDVYGGEYEWDMFTVKLHNQRGQDSGVTIKYGKNLTGLTQEDDGTDTISGIYPYWYQDETMVTCNPPIVYIENASTQTAIPVDFSGEFEAQPTPEQLKQAAQKYLSDHDIGEPKVSITISFLQLEQMVGYESMKQLEKCDLCDTVTVIYGTAEINVQAEIVSEKTDVLLERYDKLEVGNIRPNIAQTIANQQTQINQAPTWSILQIAVANATNWITGGRGGYVIFQLNANGQPDEILIMDEPDINEAKNVWRWNQGGFGHSSTGYNGPYTTAITQDGAIVANFITAGTMMANMIKGGTLTLGGLNNGNGVCQVLDSNGELVVQLDQNGINVLKGTISGASINLGYFTVSEDGTVVATNGQIGPWLMTSTTFQTTDYGIQITKQSNGSWMIYSESGTIWVNNGTFTGDVSISGDLTVGGKITAIGGVN